MATLSVVNPTLVDITKGMDPNGSVALVAELLNQSNEILDDMPWMEGNLPTGHRSTIRTGLPTPTWRKLYGGVQPTKADKAQVTDTCGMIEDYAEVDKAEADLNGNTQAWRLSEDAAHIEGMSQAFASALVYEDEKTNPERITGFMPRFNSLSAGTGTNILNASGSGSDNTSILLVCWATDKVFGIYPKGSQAGLKVTDKGQVTIENADGSNGRMEAYRTHYKWDCGLVVRDWRYVVRICNIDISDLTKNAATGADLIDLMMRALELPPSLNNCNPVFYANRTIRSFFNRQAMNKSVNQLTREKIEVNGFVRRVPMFDGIPIKRVDKILNSETAVS